MKWSTKLTVTGNGVPAVWVEIAPVTPPFGYSPPPGTALWPGSSTCKPSGSVGKTVNVEDFTSAARLWKVTTSEAERKAAVVAVCSSSGIHGVWPAAGSMAAGAYTAPYGSDWAWSWTSVKDCPGTRLK